MTVQCIGLPRFDNLAMLHDHHFVRHIFHDGQIMGNKQIRQTEFILQILQQIENLRLYLDIESRNRLIAHQNFRLHRQATRNGDPLALST